MESKEVPIKPQTPQEPKLSQNPSEGPHKSMLDIEKIQQRKLLEQEKLFKSVRELRDTLEDERQKKILTRRFGLDDSEPATLDEVAKELGLSRERIRQLEGQALGPLRRRR
ncbi:hypothetical protein HYT02_05165 [Candidatus Gottesmanbacteria bacterium]|nr:hypothetical protein [Candidatus Gottesmanbacteria bacterium]